MTKQARKARGLEELKELLTCRNMDAEYDCSTYPLCNQSLPEGFLFKRKKPKSQRIYVRRIKSGVNTQGCL